MNEMLSEFIYRKMRTASFPIGLCLLTGTVLVSFRLSSSKPAKQVHHPLLHDVTTTFKNNVTNCTNKNVTKYEKRSKETIYFVVRTNTYDPFYTICPKRGRQWTAVGRDEELIRILAVHTDQLKGCHGAPGYASFFMVRELEVRHVYSEAMYWVPNLMNRVDYLYPHAQERLCLVVRQADFADRSIFDAFEAYVYISIGLYLVIVYTALRLSYNLNMKECAFETLANFLTGSLSNRRHRLLIWGTLFNIVILNSFSGVFTSFLTIPKRGHQIDTLEEVPEYIDMVYIPDAHYEFYFRKLDKTVNPKLFSLFTNELRDSFMGQFHRKALLDTDSSFRRMLLEKSYRYYNTDIRQVKECLWTSSYVSFPVRKGWKLAKRYSELLQRLVQGGIVSKVTEDGWRNFSSFLVRANRSNQITITEKVVRLDLQHFKESFFVLGGGLICAILCLLSELVPNMRQIQVLP